MELRLYNLKNHFQEKYDKVVRSLKDKRAKIFSRGFHYTNIGVLISFLGTILVTVIFVFNTYNKRINLGDLTLLIGLSTLISSSLNYVISNIASVFDLYVKHILAYQEFFSWPQIIDDDGEVIERGNIEIEFVDVSFAYPNTNKNVLDKISFKIHKGEKIALIGENGAGKSTIIKLLLRFYEPQSGLILINNKDIRTYSLTSLYALFGVSFQDVYNYALSIEENIVLSNINEKDNLEKIHYTVKMANIEDICQDLPNGLATPLTREFVPDGIELSKGQWQKIAIARTFFRDACFYILDEPSSALDPKAEDYIFSSFKELCKNNGGIIISHRLSCVIMVDKIYLLDSGKIIEQGTHQELMMLNGKYVKLFKLQAKPYTEVINNE